MNTTPFSIKYRVLKPNHSINQLCKALRTTPYQYQLGITQHHCSIRKYQFDCPNIQQLLQVAQWRFDTIPQVAHCYFVRLSRPRRQLKTMECETFIEHMQVSVHQLSKLIIQECFYLMVHSAIGYKQLISKFKKVSVNSKTIGLNSYGQGIVWLNGELNSLSAEEQGVETESQIICRIIKVIKQRSERICEGLLEKMMQQVLRKQMKIKGFLQYINSLVHNMKLNLPKDLKYLVNQHKIIRDVQKLRLKTEVGPPMKPKQLQTQRYRPMRTQSRQNGLLKQQSKICSEIQLFDTHRGGNSFEKKKVVTEKAINSKKESYLSTNISSAQGFSDKKLQFRNYSNDRKIFNFNFSKSRERTVISKCKSYQGQNQSIYIINAAKPLQKLKWREKQQQSKKSSLDKYKMDESLKSNFSQRINSFRQESRKVDNRKIYKSFVVDLPKRNDYKNKSIGEECQEQESSPNKEKIRIQQDRVNGSMEAVENIIPQDGQWEKAEECLKANQWIKNLDSHQLWVQQKLKTSITLGNQKSSYLDDVKLQKLQKLSRQMAASRIPNEDFFPLYSQTIIE